MRIRRWIGCLVIAMALVASAGGATAEDRWIVAGWLQVVDEDERRIFVNGNLLHVGPRAKIKRGGEVVRWDDVVERGPRHVSALVRRGVGEAAEVITIVLDDELRDPS